MASKRTGLSAAFVSKVNEPGKYNDGMGTGLMLVVQPSGSRSWLQRIMIRGKRRDIGLGGYPIISLAEAREMALENKRIVARGGDPVAEKRKRKSTPTFKEAAELTHEEVKGTFSNVKDANAFLNTLDRYVFKRFGNVPLPDVTSQDIRQAILEARKTAPTVAEKLTYRISRVFKWRIAENHCTSNPAISQVLALPKSTHVPTHRKALHYNEVADCLSAVQASQASPSTKLAIEFTVLTAGRSNEIRGAGWPEFEFDNAEIEQAQFGTWNIPAKRMKSRRAHRVPLSARAIEILKQAKKLDDGSSLVFPGTKKGNKLSDMTLSKLIKELGFSADVHGFRTSFRTWTQEQTDYPRDMAEIALAHSVGDKVEEAYARSDMLERRRLMMEHWSQFISGAEPDKVVELKSRA